MKKRALAVLILAVLSLTACQSGKEAKKEETYTQEINMSDSQASADGSTELKSADVPEERDKASLEVVVREPDVEGSEKKKFEKRMNAEIGEEIEIQVHYKNLSEVRVENVFVKFELPSDDLEYVDQSALLYRSDNQDGLKVENNTLFDDGINIGNYAPRGDGYIRFRCKVKGDGEKEYRGNLKVSATSFDGIYLQSDWAGIYVRNAQIQIDHSVRLSGSEKWEKAVEAKEGDLVEFRVHYENNTGEKVQNVMLRVSLPDSIEYVGGTTLLYNGIMMDGAVSEEDGLTADGVNIGDYENGEQANVVYSVRVKSGLEEGRTREISWAKISADDITNQDSAEIYLTKKLEE
jgi:lipoprotein